MDEHLPRKSKTGISYAESELSDIPSDESPSRKKKKLNPLPLLGPSDDQLRTQGYITRSKNKDTGSTPTPKSLPKVNTEEPKTPPASPKSNFTVTTHGLVKQKKVWNFKCKLCNCVTTSCKELNDHHKTRHDKVSCPTCNKTFNTPSSLDRHVYSHKEDLKHGCEHCDKVSAFESQYDSHMVIHRKLATLKCNKSLPNGSICDKWFKRARELKKHMKVHDNFLWKCTDCQYSTNDEYNLKQHHRKHTGVKPIKCMECGKTFKYWMQRDRHKCKGPHQA